MIGWIANHKQTTIAAIVAVVFCVLFLLRACGPRPVPAHSSGLVIVRDTIIKIVPETTVVYNGHAHVVHDTTYVVVRDSSGMHIEVTPGFIASHDTTIGKITVMDTFRYPAMLFSTVVHKAPDSVMFVEKTLFLHDTISYTDKRPLWMDILSHLGAAVVGYGVGRVR